MADGTWLGGSGGWNDWWQWNFWHSPNPGDTGAINSGVLWDVGNDLSGSTINIASNTASNAPLLSVRNVTLGAVNLPFTQFQSDWASIWTAGTTNLNGPISISGGRGDGHLYVTIRDGTLVNNSRIGSSGFLTIAGSGTFENDSLVYLNNEQTTVNAPVTGSGTFDIEGSPVGLRGTLEFGSSVGAGVTVTMGGQENPPVLVIDNPMAFLAQITFQPTDFFRAPNDTGYGPAQIVLPHTAAASESVSNGVMSLFNSSGSQVGTLRFTDTSLTTGSFKLTPTAGGGTLISQQSSPIS